MSESLCFKVDGEWFTDFIRKLYYAEDKSYEECKEKLLVSLCLGHISEDDKEELAQAIIFGDKKFIGVNDLDLVDDVEFDVYKYSRIPRPTRFIEGKGITGILTKDGVFAECEYGEHNSTINFMDNGHQNLSGAVIFSIGSETGVGINCDSYVKMDTTWSKLSKYQIRWYEKNKKYLNERQVHTFERYMK
ncbi:hypothetical protein FDC26_14205 [Clostridium botulinum]|uniref:hypothetical protein n=1 Tax=unclassified Clostridium TaxID=2614128 RepID=UPI0013CB7560|nr:MULTISPECIES: hypothetical protein [unclassified Clostridium]NFM11394.1 hypothetical protein [Clostridium botulinum]NFN78002.1 hypothetical protein [Clostridium botulinum]NFO75052.1 hypothetical protein [Clostridium botulinum]NFO78812.1 hypothetical protein [Clostridium botulinum]NFP05734.1 hypothetical protein [Clostridium botulinum]